MSKIFLIDPQTGNNYQGDDQTVTNVKRKTFLFILIYRSNFNSSYSDCSLKYYFIKKYRGIFVGEKNLLENTSEKILCSIELHYKTPMIFLF